MKNIQKANNVKSTTLIVIESCIKDIRAARTDRSIPCLIGEAWTVAVKDQHNAYARVDGGYNFSGEWNNGTTYWAYQNAVKVLSAVQAQRKDIEVELVHHNNLRDRSEQASTRLLKALLPHRNLGI